MIQPSRFAEGSADLLVPATWTNLPQLARNLLFMVVPPVIAGPHGCVSDPPEQDSADAPYSIQVHGVLCVAILYKAFPSASLMHFYAYR
jgi:hypothetical protein